MALHSITLSARAIIVGGISRPSVFAVLGSMMSSKWTAGGPLEYARGFSYGSVGRDTPKAEREHHETDQPILHS
jgi:hypothetical protein